MLSLGRIPLTFLQIIKNDVLADPEGYGRYLSFLSSLDFSSASLTLWEDIKPSISIPFIFESQEDCSFTPIDFTPPKFPVKGCLGTGPFVWSLIKRNGSPRGKVRNQKLITDKRFYLKE